MKVKRDNAIVLKNNLVCNWITKENWHYLKVSLEY